MQTVKHKIFGSGEVKEQIGACGNCTVIDSLKCYRSFVDP